MKASLKLYLVTDQSYHPNTPLEEQVELAIKGGVTCVQLREKHLDKDAQIALGKRIHEITQKYGVPLIINDFPDIALAVQAEGVHIGQEDLDIKSVRKLLGPNAIIGVTAKTESQAVEAELQGADYIGVGALFASPTKTVAQKITFETFESISKTVHIPIVVIGGINAKNLSQIAHLKFDGVAVVSALLDSEDILETTQSFKKQLEAIL